MTLRSPGAEAEVSPCILIVEDEPLIALDLEISFEDAGYRVLGPASTVKDALKLLETERATCASLDYNLGAETSVPVAKALSEASVPFVFVTGYGGDITIEDDLPNARVLTKPVEPAEIIKALSA